MTTLADVPVPSWLRLAIVVAAAVASGAFLVWFLRNAPLTRKQQRAAIADSARHNDDIEFITDVGAIAVDLTLKIRPCLCRTSDPRLNGRQQRVLDEYAPELLSAGTRFVGFAVRCATAGRLHRVDEGMVWLIFLDTTGMFSAAISCDQAGAQYIELESELSDGTWVSTWRVVNGPELPPEPFVRRETVSLSIEELVARHRRRLVDAAVHVLTDFDALMASQRRQDVARMREALTRGLALRELIGE